MIAALISINNSVVSNWIQLIFISNQLKFIFCWMKLFYKKIFISFSTLFFYKNQKILLHLGVFFSWGSIYFLFCSYFLSWCSNFVTPLNSILQKDVGQSFETFATVLAIFFHQKPTFKVFGFVRKSFLSISASALFFLYSSFLPNFSLIILINLFL